MSSDSTNKISREWDEVISEVADEQPDFPKYTTQLMNMANQNAQGTRPKVVGQLSELIQQCPNPSHSGWKEWYLDRHPEAIDKAVEKIWPMIENFRDALEKIDREMVRKWVQDLIFNKTAEGLIVQEAVLEEISDRRGEDYSLAKPDDEAKNIDGYIGEEPVSIKPESYKSKDPTVKEDIDVEIIYYKKTNKYLHIFVDEED